MNIYEHEQQVFFKNKKKSMIKQQFVIKLMKISFIIYFKKKEKWCHSTCFHATSEF